MKRTARLVPKLLGVVGLVVLLAALVLHQRGAVAGDHFDAPQTQGDGPADIGSFYAWYDGVGVITVVLTYNPGLGAGASGVYDDEVLYTVCIDNTGTLAEARDVYDNDNDNLCDIPVEVRFGQDGGSDWGVQVKNLPGATGTVVGPVETVVNAGGGLRVWAGVADDPFFFDFDGLAATLSNLVDDADPADLAFAGLTGTAEDTFAGSNVMAIVLEIDATAARNGSDFLQLWATTGRLP